MNENNNEKIIGDKVIVRYPPSPTGNLHIGNIRSLLFNFLYAKKQGGEAVMRFEDTDRERSKSEFEDVALETLSDLGILFDRGPFRQSDRTEFYVEAIDTLIKNDMAYEGEESNDGSGKVIRFRNPNKEITFDDGVRGEITIDTTDFGDFVIARSKTNPIYHLTVVVDDIDMGITNVLRGEDHITSTPRQILLFEALGAKPPVYSHLPLIIGDDKKKLGKRHGAVTWDEFKKLGYLSEAIVNQLALLGWNPGDEREIFSMDELIKEFSIERINKSPATFSYEKLDDLNKEWMDKMDFEDYKSGLMKFVSEDLKSKFDSDSEKADKIISMVVRERISKFSEIKEMEENDDFSMFFDVPDFSKIKWTFKDDSEEDSRKNILSLVEKLEDISDWTADSIKDSIWDWTAEVGRGNVLHPFRSVMSGKERSPDPFTISEIVGKEEALSRLKSVSIN